MKKHQVLFVLGLWTGGVAMVNVARTGEIRHMHITLCEAGCMVNPRAQGPHQCWRQLVYNRRCMCRRMVAAPGRERPADVLLCNAADIRVGTVEPPVGKVVLDIGIVCPQADASHRGAGEIEGHRSLCRNKVWHSMMLIRCALYCRQLYAV